MITHSRFSKSQTAKSFSMKIIVIQKKDFLFSLIFIQGLSAIYSASTLSYTQSQCGKIIIITIISNVSKGQKRINKNYDDDEVKKNIDNKILFSFLRVIEEVICKKISHCAKIFNLMSTKIFSLEIFKTDKF